MTETEMATRWSRTWAEGFLAAIIAMSNFSADAAPNGSFQRVSGQSTTKTDATANVLNPDVFQGPNQNASAAEPIAMATSTSEVTNSSAHARAHAEQTALNLVPINGNTFTPEATVSSFYQDTSSTTDASLALTDHQFGSNYAIANGTYQLSFSNGATQGQFHGFLYLVAIDSPLTAGNTAVATIDESTGVNASISVGGQTYGVAAQFQPDSQDWRITGNLPDDLNLNFTASSVNHHFDFVVPVGDGTVINEATNAVAGVSTLAAGSGPGSGAMASIDLTMSGLAWGIATPNDALLLSADFNGDGAVNSADYDVWRANFGMTIGASGPRGDANLDGAVDASDYVIWRRQNGVTNSSSLATTMVPEPRSAIVAFYGATLFFTGVGRLKRN